MPRCDICGLNQQKSHHTNRLPKILGSPRIRLHHFGQHPTSRFFLANFCLENFFYRWSSEMFVSYQKKPGFTPCLDRLCSRWTRSQSVDQRFWGVGRCFSANVTRIKIFIHLNHDSYNIQYLWFYLILFDYLDPNWHILFLYPYQAPSPVFPPCFFLFLRSLAM